MLRRTGFTCHAGALCLALIGLLAGCASDKPIVQAPTTVRTMVPTAGVEISNPGAIYQPNGPLLGFYQDAPPRQIGDTVKIVISESLVGSSKVNTSNSRSNSLASKGPGQTSDSLGAIIKTIMNQNVTASGSDNFTGKGQTDNTQTLQGKLAASVINILPNGNLIVAGEKTVAFNGSVNTLRFSGVINPRDIKSGRTVASEDVVDARLEQVGQGGVARTTSMDWLQQFLTDTLTIW